LPKGLGRGYFFSAAKLPPEPSPLRTVVFVDGQNLFIDRRGIDRTDWIRIDRATYDSCLDRMDYRPKPAR
jgi:hypothetical protein